MTETQSMPLFGRAAHYLAGEALCLLLGAGLTFAMFFGVARFENVRPAAAQPDIEDLHVVSAVAEPPPPKREEHVEPPEAIMPLTGIDIGSSDSAVKIAVVPPDMDRIIPPMDLPPRATIQFNQLLTDLRPKVGLTGDFQHIYQQNEVDQAPKAIVTTIARVSKSDREDVDSLRVTLVLVIDTEGAIQSIRVIRASGNPRFDKIVLECVRDEWEFSPAIKKGKKVRCMVQQLVWYKWTGGSPFTL
ncbi:MAG TPA: TonB family protein [Opitutaceae bacterium]